MTDTNRTEIIVLLDRSGSMSTIKNDVEPGFNQYVHEQGTHPGICTLTLVQFDTGGIDTVHEDKPIREVPPLHLEPRGGTPLLDAIGQTITRVGNRLAVTPDDRRPGKVIFVIITDGHENSSREFSKDQIKQMVEHQMKAYNWQFVYLGANVDAFAEAQHIGVATAQSATYTATSAGVQAAFASTSSNTRDYRSGAAAGMSFNEQQLRSMDPSKTPQPANPSTTTSPITSPTTSPNTSTTTPPNQGTI